MLNNNTNLDIKIIFDVKQIDLVEYYNSADIFVFTPIKDSMPNVLLEASSCELAIISTNVGGISEIVKDRETGFLIPPGNAEKLGHKIDILMKDKDLRRNFGVEGRNHVNKIYSQSDAIRNLINLYETI